MGQNMKQKIALYCSSEVYPAWQRALSFYETYAVAQDQPLQLSLLQAARQNVDLFVILDGTQESDEAVMVAVQAFRENEETRKSTMRLAFVARKEREVPSYLFRVLANMDFFDIIVAPKERGADFNAYVEVARVLSEPKCYSDIVALLTGNVLNPRLIGLSSAEQMKERTRPQVRIAVAQMDQRRGGSTHTAILLARTLVLLGYQVALFVDSRTWKNLRRCYPRARCNVPNGLVSLCGVDFYRNEGFARINGYDYALADFGCARWIDIHESKEALAAEENFKTAQLAVLTSVVSPFGDHAPFERVLKIWQKKGQLQNLGGTKFAFFGLPDDYVLENWRTVAKQLNQKAELYRVPYLPDPLHYEPKGAHVPELIEMLTPVLRSKDR